VPFHLVLLHPADREIPRNTRRWLDVRQVARHHHVRRGRAADVGRVARLATGRGVGLALSGGGARGSAHIGVLRALTEAGVPVDLVGGTSAGAAVGAPWAAGAVLNQPWDGDPDWRFVLDGARREFLVKKPFGLFTLPVYSFLSPRRLDRIFRDHFQDLDIADMWLPFLCVASDLHTGEKVVFESGPIWKAVRASISLPGIVPPVVDGDRLLVDGGVLDNVPEGEVKAACGGPVIAVDVSSVDRIPLEYQYESMPSPFEVIRSRVSPFRKSLRIAGLLEVLVRTATVSGASRRTTVDEVADLVLRPPVSGFGLLEFEALDAMAEEAYTYTMERLSEWKGPIARPPEGTG
jgi:NTE family protein/lysophospholipid hydrolase